MVSTGFREMLPLLQSFPGAAEKSLFWHLQLSSSLTWLFFMFFPLTPLCDVFCPFLSTFSPRHHHLCWEAQLCPVVCPMEAAGTICMQQPQSLLTEGTSSALPPLKPWHLHPISPTCSVQRWRITYIHDKGQWWKKSEQVFTDWDKSLDEKTEGDVKNLKVYGFWKKTFLCSNREKNLATFCMYWQKWLFNRLLAIDGKPDQWLWRSSSVVHNVVKTWGLLGEGLDIC